MVYCAATGSQYQVYMKLCLVTGAERQAPFGFCFALIPHAPWLPLAKEPAWLRYSLSVRSSHRLRSTWTTASGAGVDEGQARTNTFAEIAPCPRCQAESDAVPLVRHCQWDGESQVVGCGRGAPCCPELRHRVDLWAVLAEGPDNRRRNPAEALDLSGDRRGPGFALGRGQHRA
jgi:hypothetical protein